MRWQSFGHEMTEGMYDDLTTYSLENLYKKQDWIEKHLAELRSDEPSTKRKNEKAHQIWFAMCQGCIDELKEIRDAIINVKAKKEP